jgi:hypothetical protein
MNFAVGTLSYDASDQISAPVREAVDRAVNRIAPAWPLESTVAVNPFVGQTNMRLAEVSAVLEKLIGQSVLMPADWYQARIKTGEISAQDLQTALLASDYTSKPKDITGLKAAIKQLASQTGENGQTIPNFSQLASCVTATDWPQISQDMIGRWAAAHFDRGAALWAFNDNDDVSAWQSWRDWAACDRTAELLGATGFCSAIHDLPGTSLAAIDEMLALLNPDHIGLENQFHQTLLLINGWAQHGRYLRWVAELGADQDDTIIDLLAIRLSFDFALYQACQDEIDPVWQDTLAQLACPIHPTAGQVACEIAQQAYELSLQDNLAQNLSSQTVDEQVAQRPNVQAAFCIDVRSEVFRRAFEGVASDIETKGFAGFFGLPVEHQAHGSTLGEKRLPVLLAPALKTRCDHPGHGAAQSFATKLGTNTARPWHQFRTAAISSFAYVDAIGPAYIWQLIKRTLGLSKANGNKTASPKPAFDAPLDLTTKCEIAAKVLRAMSLTDNFAKMILLVGHGANVTNNPHASALHCGACGGHAGDVNARLLAGLLNDPDVRQGLVENGITIPDDSVFIAGLHDTTTDQVTLFEQDVDQVIDPAQLLRLKEYLHKAAIVARTERIAKLPGALTERDVTARATNWAETRPEWGLAGCKYFIAAPRGYSKQSSLCGESFLHDYDRAADAQNGYAVLELILTAPVVVASWISLQYYASSVAPDLFGGGNKLLHNVVGGIGVYEGNGGNLRTGLPIQSVHDGVELRHDPARLTVCLDAPISAIDAILKRHPAVQQLFDQQWLHLLAFDESGTLAHRYIGQQEWTGLTR